MASGLRVARAALLALAASAAHCAFELRTIVVDGDASLPDASADAPAPDALEEGPDAPPADGSSPDAPSPDVPAPDAPALDGGGPDAPALDTGGPDVVEPDVPSPDAPTLDAPDAPDSTGACAPGELRCNGACVDPGINDDHCGACGTVCSLGTGCVMGRCVSITRAGAACTMPATGGGLDPAACGNRLRCISTETTPMCSLACTNNSSLTTERNACGGGNATCLSYGDGSTARSQCTQSCSPGARPGATLACRSGFLCTGWWFTHATSTPDAPGCVAFCANDSQCPSGLRCNPRDGVCSVRGIDLTKLADGMPCDPTMVETPPGYTVRRNYQCRGICFNIIGARPTEGVCGSFVNLALSPSCPDSPSTITPGTADTPDNLGLCIERSCVRNANCTAPLVCRYYEDDLGRPATGGPSACLPPTASQPNGRG